MPVDAEDRTPALMKKAKGFDKDEYFVFADYPRLRHTYSQLLEYYREETHMAIAKIYERGIKASGHKLADPAMALKLVANASRALHSSNDPL